MMHTAVFELLKFQYQCKVKKQQQQIYSKKSGDPGESNSYKEFEPGSHFSALRNHSKTNCYNNQRNFWSETDGKVETPLATPV